MAGIRLHPRTRQVASASAVLTSEVIMFAERRELTNVEMLVILADVQQVFVKLALRAERHPDDPDRKADEA